MTEDEAKTKWCPFVRVAGSNMHEPATNRDRWGGSNGNCLGPGCMAWRWGKEFHRSKKTGVLLEESHLFRNDPDFELVVHGFCGLAGRP